MAKQNKNPWLAAVFNLLLPGVGYVYAGKRMIFGAGLALLSIVIGIYWLFFEIPFIMWADSLIVTILLAYDGYETAKEPKRK